MKHEKKMWMEEKQLIELGREAHESRVAGTEESSGQLRSELSLAREGLERRTEQVKVLRTELRKLKEAKMKVDAQLASAQDKLMMASELDDLKLEEFVTMRNSNLEVARKIERFMEKTAKAQNTIKAEVSAALDDDEPLTP